MKLAVEFTVNFYQEELAKKELFHGVKLEFAIL